MNSGRRYGTSEFLAGRESTKAINRVFEEMRDERVSQSDGAGGELKIGVNAYFDTVELLKAVTVVPVPIPFASTKGKVTTSFGLRSSQVLIKASQCTTVPASHSRHDV